MITKQCQHVDSPTLCSALQYVVLLLNTQREKGLNNGCLYCSKGQKAILALMEFRKSDFITTHHLWDSTEDRKLEIGCSGPLFENNISPLTKCTTKSWVTITWNFLWDNNMVIEEKILNMEPQCWEDSHIKTYFLRGSIQR